MAADETAVTKGRKQGRAKRMWVAKSRKDDRLEGESTRDEMGEGWDHFEILV